jgi:type III secretory pathway component EscT
MVQFVFALSNGIVASTAFMVVPRIVQSLGKENDMDYQNRASQMVTFAVCFGLLSGSILSFPYMEVATQILSW